MPASAANIAAPSGNVPNAATSPSEFADASWSGSFTMLGTVASFAGPHSSVSISIDEREDDEPQRSSPERQYDEQPARARCRSVTITTLRFHRSTSAPPNGASTKPGSMRAIITRPTAVAECDTRCRDREDREEPDPVAQARRRTARRTAEGSPARGSTRHGAGGIGSLVRGRRDERRLRRSRGRFKPSGSRSLRRWLVGRFAAAFVAAAVLRRLLRRPSSSPSWRSSSSPSSRSSSRPSWASSAPSPARARKSAIASGSVSSSGSVATRHGRVRRAVGDVRPVPTVEHAHRRPGVGMLPELGERRLLLAAAPRFGCAYNASASASVIVSSCSSAARLRVSPSARLRYGPNRPGDARISRSSASMPTDARQRQQLQRLVERDGLGRLTREERRALRLLLRALFLLAELHVGAEAPGERVHRRARSRDRSRAPSGPRPAWR